ncbi:hypothetical protein [Parvibacter caecicola]|uniref:hypothetical protein n=1 Tax=Parvibacter caecicola TaxID=747645 RepID=UPI00249CDAB6|nr:hypothetical protein [Parvibacter caecicola]
MTIYANNTSLSLLRHLRLQLGTAGPEAFSHTAAGQLKLVSGHSIPQAKPNNSDIQRMKQLLSCSNSPFHTQTLKQHRVSHPDLICHTVLASSIEDKFVEVEHGVFCLRPEETIRQLCQSLPFVNALLACYELCGCYVLPVHPGHGSAVSGAKPVTSPTRISTYVNRPDKARGRRATLEVLRFVVPFAASPMESAIVIILVLPRRYGGYGLPLPQLNRQVNASMKNADGSIHKTFYLDAYWPDFKLAMEYDSDEFHFSSIQDAYRDADRRIWLAKKGLDTVVLTKKQAHDLALLDRAASAIASKMGKRLRLTDPDYKAKRAALHAALFPQAYRDDLVPCECYF